MSREAAALGPVRRIVTGHDASGKSVVLSDAPTPKTLDIGTAAFHEIWITDETPAEEVLKFPGGLADYLKGEVGKSQTVTNREFAGRTDLLPTLPVIGPDAHPSEFDFELPAEPHTLASEI